MSFCTYCHHTLNRHERTLHRLSADLHRIPPHLTHKIRHTQAHIHDLNHKIDHLRTIQDTHTTRDSDNVLTCPILAAYKCSRCGGFGHTPSHCHPCEYCAVNGHNERECPKKRLDEKEQTLTIVLRIPKLGGFEAVVDKLKLLCETHQIEILKEV